MLTSNDMLAFLSNQLSREEREYFQQHPKQLLRRLDGATTEATVLFCDLVGFTRFSEGHSLEQTRMLLKTALPLIAEEVRQSGGAVDKYIGDAVMAIWGAPEYPRPELDLVVLAAFRMHERVDQLEGILAAVGKAVNRAARLSTLSEAQRVFIDEMTYERLSPTMRSNCLDRRLFEGRSCRFYYYPLEHWPSYVIPDRLISFEDDKP